MNGLKLFTYVSITVIGLVILLFTGFHFLLLGSDSAAWSPFHDPDKVNVLVGFIALMIGTAATVGGAIAALQMASLGLEISKSQDKIAKREFIDSKVSTAIKLYNEIIVACGDVYASGIALDHAIPNIDKKKIDEYFKADIPVSLKSELMYFAENLDKLSSAIKSLAKDEFALSCFQKNSSTIDGKLTMITHRFLQMGFDESSVNVDINNLSDIAGFIDLASKKIRYGDYQMIIAARVFTNSPEAPIFNLPYDNASVRTFMFIGNLIFCRSEKIKSSTEIFIASYGSAMLHDLVRSIPDEKSIKNSLIDRYADIITDKDLNLVNYNPSSILSSSIDKAINDISGIGNLYFLTGNIS